MDDFEDMDVRVIDFDTNIPLTTFDTVKTIPKNSSRQRRFAIEAKADQRFAIELRIKPTFRWAECNGIEVKIGFDIGEEVNCFSIYLLKALARTNLLDLPHLVHDSGSYSYRIDRILTKNPAGSGLEMAPSHLYFRRLRDDREVTYPKGAPRSDNSQGKIRVEVARTIISLRERERGVQTDVPATYRRQTKTQLQRQGITLEVLLWPDPDPAAKVIQYKGNFKSDRPREHKQQANFDFIYREAKHHDRLVAASHIDEVVVLEGSSKTVKTKSFHGSATSGVTLSLSQNTFGRPNALHIYEKSISTDGSDLNQSKVQTHSDVALSGASQSVAPAALEISELAVKTPRTVVILQQRSSSATPSSVPLTPPDTVSSSQSTRITTPDTCRIFQPESYEILDLLKAQDRHREVQKDELQSLQARRTDIDSRLKVSRQRIDEIELELRRSIEESNALETVREDIRNQQQCIIDASTEMDERTQQALEVFRTTMKTIGTEATQSAITKKRKRSEVG